MIPRRNIQRLSVHKVRAGQDSRYANGLERPVTDFVAVEEPLEIRLVFEQDGAQVEQSISITMRTPGDDFELAAGFLVGEGVLTDPAQLAEMRYCVDGRKQTQEYNIVTVELRPGVAFDPARLARNFYTTSSCGVCGKASLDALTTQAQACPTLPRESPRVRPDVVRGLADKLRDAQAVFERTGGLHGAALFDPDGNLIVAREDVGRHNALDKLVGERFLARKLPLFNSMLMVSGRTSFEIMQKALMAGIPVVAAVGAPSSLAVDLARQFGMTLLGFVRGESFNVYAGAQRIALAG